MTAISRTPTLEGPERYVQPLRTYEVTFAADNNMFLCRAVNEARVQMVALERASMLGLRGEAMISEVAMRPADES